MDGDMNERAAEQLAQFAAAYGISTDELAEALQRVIEAIKDAFGRLGEEIKRFLDAMDELELPPPLSKLARKWLADRRRADRERERVKIKVLFERAAGRAYKPP